MTLNASIGLIFSKLAGISGRNISADFSGIYVFEEFITLMTSFSTAYERDLNKKNSEYFGISTVYKEYLTIEIRAEKNLYHEWLYNSGDYDEFLLKGTVTLKF